MAQPNTNATAPVVEPKDPIQNAPHSMPPAYEEAQKSGAAIPQPGPLPPQGQTAPQEAVIPLTMLGDESQWIDCPFCHRRAKTRVAKEGTAMQLVAGALCCFLCICFTCIPCLAGWCEERHYYCTVCNQKIATRDQDGALQIFAPQPPPQAFPPQQEAPPVPPSK